MLAVTIAVVAVLTCLIFLLAILSFKSFLKTESQSLALGEKDGELFKEEEESKKKSSKIVNVLSWCLSGLLILGMASMAGVAIGYRAQGKQFSISDKTGLVIATDSMDGFYSEEYRLQLPDDAEERQFSAGDILGFENVLEEDELVLYEVYGYKLSSGKIITHRLIGITDSGKLVFRGDNTAGRDNLVKREQVILRYDGYRIKRLGFFVLFSQSGFGLYSLISVIGVYVISDVFVSRYNKMRKERLEALRNED
jgi:hypothetical protein